METLPAYSVVAAARRAGVNCIGRHTACLCVVIGMNQLPDHQDALAMLNGKMSLNARLLSIHREAKERLPFVDRIAVALFDPKSAVLKTFISSSNGNSPLVRYESRFDDAPSLAEVAINARPRVVNDLSIFSEGVHEHTKVIQQQGYQASYTVPMLLNDIFWGFLFFNSFRKNCFSEGVLRELDVYSHLITMLVAYEVGSARMMLAALKTANDMVHERDPETGSHLDRMSHYSRLIAQQLASGGKYHFDDEYIEQIFLFAPLHDVGKIGIPDSVLLKCGRLNVSEFEIMKTHTTKGLHIVNAMIENFGFESLQNLDLLRHIAESHHEKMNGMGYPHGLKGEEIPAEARMVAVADIFDALTSRRPYKAPWANAVAFEQLRDLSRTELDSDCVTALILNEPRIRQIQSEFPDTL